MCNEFYAYVLQGNVYCLNILINRLREVKPKENQHRYFAIEPWNVKSYFNFGNILNLVNVNLFIAQSLILKSINLCNPNCTNHVLCLYFWLLVGLFFFSFWLLGKKQTKELISYLDYSVIFNFNAQLCSYVDSELSGISFHVVNNTYNHLPGKYSLFYASIHYFQKKLIEPAI